ncbi:multiprotein bridging factor 1C [Striga asiatica]|uniref:Multiprotein bridging factor 1C n=1 Tax=Striga asiatica TaxID=4170 RepID=A0A5A7RC32_STRAF|nr:multiprotein bridging factor 1C [Striga asiatica]
MAKSRKWSWSWQAAAPSSPRPEPSLPKPSRTPTHELDHFIIPRAKDVIYLYTPIPSRPQCGPQLFSTSQYGSLLIEPNPVRTHVRNERAPSSSYRVSAGNNSSAPSSARPALNIIDARSGQRRIRVSGSHGRCFRLLCQIHPRQYLVKSSL